ncbi:uncharacterized protein LOC127702593 [Mytilus californianus]|uniref:uncharacterized protein LOC127702593 n=1 Tax=Mytilus californianus TaxID=6549 RepID=UPI002245EE48|nr:uncharacterized protein LOC127702593 [Mytilus californianus]
MATNELKAFCGANFKGTKMAEHFKCSTKSVYRRLKDEGLSNRYSDITKEDLDAQILDLKSSFPKAGLQMMQGYLVSRGICVQRERVRESLRRLDPEGCVERWSTAVHKRRYSVPTPNHLWHMDGHMKLIRWGFATHGCIDGFSRFITFLRCGINNTASTVLQLFVFTCCSYGVPSRVRSDHGGENTKVALFMKLFRERTSHITGKSVHNQRIERLWRDMHTQVTSKFYNEFYQMEEDPVINLDPDNMIHRSALQYVYLPAMNRSLEEFRNGWNGHKIRSEEHMSPSQIWVSGMLDNMSSGYTPTSELFGVNPSIGDRLIVVYKDLVLL